MYKLYDPLNICNNFIEKGIKENVKVSPMKLQKLLYFFYRNYLQSTGDSLFPARFEAWKYGPVLSCVYEAFKQYGSSDIKKFYTNQGGKQFKINEKSNKDFERILNCVWDTYKRFDGIALSQITHQPGTAWYKAWMRDSRFLSEEDIMREGVSGD